MEIANRMWHFVFIRREIAAPSNSSTKKMVVVKDPQKCGLVEVWISFNTSSVKN